MSNFEHMKKSVLRTKSSKLFQCLATGLKFIVINAYVHQRHAPTCMLRN